MNDWLILTKARITALVMITAATGYVLGAPRVEVATLISLLLSLTLDEYALRWTSEPAPVRAAQELGFDLP